MEKLEELIHELKKHGLPIDRARNLYTKYKQFFPKLTASNPKSKNSMDKLGFFSLMRTKYRPVSH